MAQQRTQLENVRRRFLIFWIITSRNARAYVSKISKR